MCDRYYLWGAGSVGKRALAYLAQLDILDGIIDSDSSKQGNILYGLVITDYESIKPFAAGRGIIIAHLSFKETEEILKKDNVRHYRLSEFITKWYWMHRRRHAIGFLELPITTRCTLNCMNCMQYVPYRSKHDVPLENMKQDLEALFRRIDFVGEISIMGGEPFL